MKAIKLALHWQMGIALILGATLGIIFCDSYSAWGNVINGIGDIFADDLTHACRDGAYFFRLFAISFGCMTCNIISVKENKIWMSSIYKTSYSLDSIHTRSRGMMGIC